MYNKNYAWTPLWDINLYFLFSRKKSSYCGNHKEDILVQRRHISPGLERDPKLLMNMKKMLSGDWNAKYYQIF